MHKSLLFVSTTIKVASLLLHSTCCSFFTVLCILYQYHLRTSLKMYDVLIFTISGNNKPYHKTILPASTIKLFPFHSAIDETSPISYLTTTVLKLIKHFRRRPRLLENFVAFQSGIRPKKSTEFTLL